MIEEKEQAVKVILTLGQFQFRSRNGQSCSAFEMIIGYTVVPLPTAKSNTSAVEWLFALLTRVLNLPILSDFSAALSLVDNPQ